MVAEHYSRALAERTRDGMLQRFKQRAWTGGPAPYGYKIVHTDGSKRLAIDDTEAPVVLDIFTLYMEGSGCKEIAKALRNRGIPTRRNNKWTFTSIRAILRNDIYSGLVRFNRRKFKLNKKTGKRIPQWKDTEQVQSYQDEDLRLIDAETWQKSRERLGERRAVTPRSSLAIRPFTGLIFCEHGHKCRESKNRKGSYVYYSCSVRQRVDKDACSNAAFIREDTLLSRITETFLNMFDDTEAIIQEVTKRAEQQLQGQRQESNRLNEQLAALEKKSVGLVGLIVDPDIEPLAKKAISRQLAELETQRDELQRAKADLTEQTQGNAERMTQAVRQAFSDAKQGLMALASPNAVHAFLQTHVGPLTLKSDGSIAQVPSNEADPCFYLQFLRIHMCPIAEESGTQSVDPPPP